MRQRKTNYLTSQEIYDEWVKWRDSATNIQDRVISEKMGEYMYRVAEKIMNSPKFNRYPESIKDDMVQEAVFKMMQNLKNMNEEKKDGFFNYWTACCFCSNISFLKKYYRQMNIQRKYMEHYIETLLTDTPTMINQSIVKQIKDAIAEFDSNNNNNIQEQ